MTLLGSITVPKPSVYAGGSGGVATPAAPKKATGPLPGYISKNFGYVQQQNENALDLQDYDASSLLQEQNQQAKNQLALQQLQGAQDDAGVASAGDFAARGLLRSGLNFQAQDKINEQGVLGANSINQTLTDLLSQRAAGRVSQETANRSALDKIIQSLTNGFNKTNRVA